MNQDIIQAIIDQTPKDVSGKWVPVDALRQALEQLANELDRKIFPTHIEQILKL